MELRDIFKLIKINKMVLFRYAFLGSLVGLLIYLTMPVKYTATGSLFITRKTDSTFSNVFTYEGYYAQQTAQAYTNSITALVESPELQTNALEKLGLGTDGKTLKKYRKLIDVKKKAPQIIMLTTKDQEADAAANLWQAISNSLVEKSLEINKNGDEKISITPLEMNPVVSENYTYFYVNLFAGIIFGSILGLVAISSKEYFKK